MPIINGIFYLGGGGEPTNGLPSDLLAGKKLNNEDGDSVIGTMPNNGAVGGTITQQAGKVIIPAGYTTGGQVEANITNLAAANIKSGVSVGGVDGTFTNDANAVASDILTAKTAYVTGSKITGSMANRGAITQTISTQGGQYTVPAGYHNGSGKVTASFANLVAGNVRAGINIGGVVGNFSGLVWTGSLSITGGADYSIVPAQTIGFRPKIAIGTAANIGSIWIMTDFPIYLMIEGVVYTKYGASIRFLRTGTNGGYGGYLNDNKVTGTGWSQATFLGTTTEAMIQGTYNVQAFG